MQTNKDNLIVGMTFSFAKEVIMYTGQLDVLRKFNISNQLFRSGTSIGANVREAQNAESKADFIHKFKIAAKETDETEYWLMFCNESEGFPDCRKLIEQVTSIHKIISKIIASSKALPNHQIIKSSNQ